MAEFEYHEDFDCEEAEEETVQELLKFGIYGEETTLDGMVEAGEKNLNDTKARVAELKTLFGDEENTGNHRGAVPSKTEINMNDVNISENEDTTSVNDSPHDIAGEISDTGNKDLNLPKVQKSTSHAMPGTIGEPSNETTVDVSLQTLEASHHDTGGEHKPDVPSNTYIPTTLVHGGNEVTVDVSLPTSTEPHNKEVQILSDVESKHRSVPDGSSKDSEVETVLVSDKGGEIKSSDSNSENKLPLTLILVDAHGVENESSDVEVWKDGCPLPSSGPTCSEWQTTDDVHSSGAEAISTQVSAAGCLPECEEPRSGCVNIESVMSSEQVSHASSTSIIEDGTKIAGKERLSQYQVEDDKTVVIGSSKPKNEDQQENGKCKPKKKNKGKQKAKVHKKEKRSKDEKVEKTNSKKFHRRLLSLFCCCFKRQERNNQNNEMKQSTTENKTHCEDTSQRHSSFITIDLNI